MPAPPPSPAQPDRLPAPASWRHALPLLARRSLWALPLLLSLCFVAGMAVWDYRNSLDERDAAHRTLISDALSAEAQLRGRLDVEAAHLRHLAAQLARQPGRQGGLAGQAEVEAGFRRLWLSVTWLDANNRIIDHVPEQSLATLSATGERTAAEPAGMRQASRELLDDTTGLSAHLVAPVSRQTGLPPPSSSSLNESDANRFDVAGEKLVVRFSPAVLLKRGTPWWLTRRYEMQLVDGADQVIASVDAPGPQDLPTGRRPRDSYRVNVGGGMPGTYLQLTEREAPRPWWATLPWGLIAGFLGLVGVATVLLRRQMQQVRRAEMAWRTEAAWRQAMEDSALVGLRARDAQGRLLYVNRTFCDMVGLPAQTLLGLSPPMPYWPPDAVDEAMRRSRRNLAGLAPREGYEARWQHSDGHRLDVMVFESPLVDARGEQIGWMGSIIDISTHKQLEEQDRRRVEAMSQQARLITLGEVASALAHQLNQPLTAVAGYCAGLQRLLQRAAGHDEAMVQQALQRMGEQVAEAGRIVRRIREFLTRRAPQRESCSLEAVARRALDLLRRDLARLQVQVELQRPEGEALPEVWADPVLIEQVLINLVRNAADELVRQAADRRHIRISLQQAASSGDDPAGLAVGLAVEDDGPGLQGRSLAELSSPFFSTKPDGMGMGLSICRSVVEAHHGRLEAGASALGGACFSFKLPVQPT